MAKSYRTSHYRKTHNRKTRSGRTVRVGSTWVHGSRVRRRKK